MTTKERPCEKPTRTWPFLSPGERKGRGGWGGAASTLTVGFKPPEL